MLVHERGELGGGVGHKRPAQSEDAMPQASREGRTPAPSQRLADDDDMAVLERAKASMPEASWEDEVADYGYEYSDWEDDDAEDAADVEGMGADERQLLVAGYSAL